jgi:hypothetical protein
MAGVLSELDAFESAVKELEAPPDMHRIEAEIRHGLTLGKTEIGQCASVSIRLADPGQGPQLRDEIAHIFEGLKYISGYLGSITGANASVREEICGIALWTDRKPFDESITRGSFYEIRLFERIA